MILMNESYVTITDAKVIESTATLLTDAIVELAVLIDKTDVDIKVLDRTTNKAAANIDRRIDLVDMLGDAKAYLFLVTRAPGGVLVLSMCDARVIARIVNFLGSERVLKGAKA